MIYGGYILDFFICVICLSEVCNLSIPSSLQPVCAAQMAGTSTLHYLGLNKRTLLETLNNTARHLAYRKESLLASCGFCFIFVGMIGNVANPHSVCGQPLKSVRPMVCYAAQCLHNNFSIPILLCIGCVLYSSSISSQELFYAYIVQGATCDWRETPHLRSERSSI